MVSIQAIKAVSIGDGIEVAGLPGSEAHDEIFYDETRGYYRETNRAGGLEGGMTTGDPLVVRGSMKPLPTLTKPLRSVDIATHAPAEALRERTDSCTVPAAGVVGEAMVAFVVADAYRRKFGGDHIDDVKAALARLPRSGSGGTDRADRLHGRWQDDAARVLGRSAADVDEVIEARRGRRVQDIFAQEGETAFREVEEQVTLELLADSAVEVVALGGGAIGSARVREALAGCRVIWLETVWEDAWQRVEGNGSRPLASDMRRFNELHDARRPVYESLADVIVPATRSREIQAVIEALAGLPGKGTRTLWATSAAATTRSTSARAC